jgi:hypothetical protein
MDMMSYIPLRPDIVVCQPVYVTYKINGSIFHHPRIFSCDFRVILSCMQDVYPGVMDDDLDGKDH